jgi:hypothetical protein
LWSDGIEPGLQCLDGAAADQAGIALEHIGLEFGPGGARARADQPIDIAHGITQQAQGSLQLSQLAFAQLIQWQGIADTHQGNEFHRPNQLSRSRIKLAPPFQWPQKLAQVQ